MQCRDSQFVGRHEHDRPGALLGVLAAFFEIVANRAVRTRGADGPGGEQSLGKHLLIADDGWPWRVSLETRPVVVAWLAV